MSKPRIRILRDDDPRDPREDCDNATVFAFFHNRYRLGDEGHGLRAAQFAGWGQMKDHITKTIKPVYITPVYLYDHSGITISSTPFVCPWDSGQIGFAWITREKLAECFGSFPRLTQRLKERSKNIVEESLRTYDQYLTGDVYGFIVEEPCNECGTWHKTDSCWGFYGRDLDENGIRDYVGDLIDDGAEVIYE